MTMNEHILKIVFLPFMPEPTAVARYSQLGFTGILLYNETDRILRLETELANIKVEFASNKSEHAAELERTKAELGELKVQFNELYALVRQLVKPQ